MKQGSIIPYTAQPTRDFFRGSSEMFHLPAVRWSALVRELNPSGPRSTLKKNTTARGAGRTASNNMQEATGFFLICFFSEPFLRFNDLNNWRCWDCAISWQLFPLNGLLLEKRIIDFYNKHVICILLPNGSIMFKTACPVICPTN